MNRTEDDLHTVLGDLAARADREDASPTEDLVGDVSSRSSGDRQTGRRRTTWLLPPATAALVVAGVAVAATVGGGHHAADTAPASPRSSANAVTPPPPAVASPLPLTAGRVLADAAVVLDHRPWTEPRPNDFFTVRTTEATIWTSVSGLKAGKGVTATGETVSIPGCRHGQIVSTGESGPCTLHDVPHYLADAPTVPAAWDAYLEHLAPGSRSGGAQGKIIVQVLHGDLVSPQAAAALLRFTAGCPGLHLIDIAPANDRALLGLTCTSMSAGSYGLVFDATMHDLVGFQPVDPDGTPQGPAEIVTGSGTVPAIGRTP